MTSRLSRGTDPKILSKTVWNSSQGCFLLISSMSETKSLNALFFADSIGETPCLSQRLRDWRLHLERRTDASRWPFERHHINGVQSLESQEKGSTSTSRMMHGLLILHWIRAAMSLVYPRAAAKWRSDMSGLLNPFRRPWVVILVTFTGNHGRNITRVIIVRSLDSKEEASSVITSCQDVLRPKKKWFL
jgi:hypothetical protein